MGLKKSLCPHCHQYNELKVFEVSPETPISYCPFCGKPFIPSAGIALYNRESEIILHRADTLIIDNNNALGAYQAYGKLIADDSNNVYLRYGRILSLLCLSTVRNSTILQAADLFEEETFDNFKKVENVDRYISFVRRTSAVINRYLTSLRKRLCIGNNFIDLDCVGLYVKRVRESLDFLKTCEKEIRGISNKKGHPESAEILHSALEKTMESKKSILKGETKFTILDGHVYRLVGFTNTDHTPKFSVESYQTNNRYNYAKLPTLNKQKGHPYIKDELLHDDTNTIRFYKYAAPILLLGFLGAAIALGVFTYTYKDSTNIAPYLLVSTLACAVAFIAVLILRLCIFAKLKKRRNVFGGVSKF